ncbi:GTP cyclohydrolase FolE2 [Pseudomonas sp. GD03842]|uniref:GTP cyclohydrolase FolE2 n=1 Tax=Pseudomonas sp. GD03842 TaxID=2975385 RepID=UPI00244D5F3E|nr:GTP cyclohydrolase FolE2 [Pseudomonas sp. GD03842]MDH0747796.1 GTP cyclohydrolase FolE2 [Pseudomonas sp. GD03842]
MTTSLPDVASSEPSYTSLPLDWVGMQGIDIPLNLDEPGIAHLVHALADLQVDLPVPQIKGIHMSRLYTLLDRFAEHQAVSPASLAALLELMVASHADCHSTRARLRLAFQLLCKRPALVTEGLSGWKSYPVTVDAQWQQGALTLEVSVDVTYSSTCPCSAALSRQLLEQAFVAQFGAGPVDSGQVAQWIGQHGSYATPHSQRSVARVQVPVHPQADRLGLLPLIELIEDALGTPVQTAVKRADEQAFARLNGQHLMYVEDAVRKVQQALIGKFPVSHVSVVHRESLHPHDAVASSSMRPVRNVQPDAKGRWA